MYYLLKDRFSLDWKDVDNSLFLYHDQTFVKTYKWCEGSSQINPTNLTREVEHGFKSHIVDKADNLEELEFKALALMLTL